MTQFMVHQPRVGLFVDTQNLYHSSRDHYDRPVNFETILKHATKDRHLMRAVAYVVEKEGDTSAWPFIYKLSTLGYRVRRMNLQINHVNDQGKPIWEGNWDMGMVADMTRLIDQLDILVLGSGDGDFVDMLEVFMERGVRTEVLAFKETTAQRLIDCVDRFTHLPEIETALMPIHLGNKRNNPGSV
ncbi:MAG: NYN domain-containing protein [Deinococcaceae bacterium]